MRWIFILLSFFLSSAAGQNTISFLSSPGTGASAYSPPALTNTVIPLEVVRGMLYVKAEIGGKEGNFILDTGAPTLVVNRKPTEAGAETAVGLNNELTVSWIEIDDFKWAGIQRNRLPALAVDISHLEKKARRPIMGMIGFDLLQNYELFFDYHGGKLVYYQPGINPLHKAGVPVTSIPFEMQGHIPVIKVTVGEKVLSLGIDTGAASNLLSESLLEELAARDELSLSIEEVQGLDQSIKRVTSAVFPQITVEDFDFKNMPFLFTDISHIQLTADMTIDGLIGTPLLERLKFSINYPDKKIHIWKIK